jgi:hypothetical protein
MRLTKRVVAAAATVLVAIGFAVALAGPASAAHPLNKGFGTSQCVAEFKNPRNSYQAVLGTVQAVGSDVPKDALIAASATLSTDPASPCVDGTPLVLRAQIDRLELDYVGPGTHHIYKSTGPINVAAKNGHVTINAQTPGQASLPCANLLQIRMYFSVRYTNNILLRSSFQGATFTRC